MAISFSCPACGRKLKAPDNAAGKASKCPGCGGAVICPEPVYDAELIAVTPDGPGELGELDPDQPYAVVPEPVAEVPSPAADARRPCPMCGEMIIATAAKCRFCGEIFDETLRKGGMVGGGKEMKAIAASQRNYVTCALVILGGFIVSGALGPANRRVDNPAVGLVSVIIGAAILGALVAAMVYTFILGKKVFNVWAAIPLALLAGIPCVGLLVMLLVNQRVTQLLKDHGYEVGFFGAKVA